MNDTSRRIGILGLGRSGRAAAELALARGAEVYASDIGRGPALQAAAEAVRRAGGVVELGRHNAERLAACDLVVVSPGIPPDSPVLQRQRVRAVPRVSELEFAYRALRAPMIAVTGTNGKTTTTALAAHLLRAAGRVAPAAGNIGLALSEVARQPPPPDWAVVEASSFQLGGIDRFRPRIGVLTNLAPDHLDRYPSVEAYYADKARLFENASPESVWILDGDDETVLELAGDAPGRRYLFRRRPPAHAAADADGDIAAQRRDPAESAGYVTKEGGHLAGEGGHRTEEGGHLAEGGGHLTEEGALVLRLGGHAIRLLGPGELQMLGEHNALNALAAALAAVAVGVRIEDVRNGLRTFRPLAHRLEPVAERDGVLWINDSKATNTASTRVALRSMTRPTVLLLGGRHKGETYSKLLPELGDHAHLVVAYGEAGPLIAADLAGHIEVDRIDGPFEEAVETARARARPGDTVLLSPACASYDMFRDYEERGRRFAALARAAAAVAGAEVVNGG